ncbi:MAG: D-sedoheptulose-7-phosphate isomerase [Rhodospirillaceae bacterium]
MASADKPDLSGTWTAYLEESLSVLEAVRTSVDPAEVDKVVAVMTESLAKDLPLLVCGNGGSASDAMHITGELVGRFLEERRALNVICLSSNPAVLTAWSNDYSYDTVFSRQTEAYARPGGCILGISTSGNSNNVIEAFKVAKARGMITVGLTGQGGGKMAPFCDYRLEAPSKSTPLIQQVHIVLYHYLCARMEVLLKG